jgi:AmiR/NasT family two-component response regulator
MLPVPLVVHAHPPVRRRDVIGRAKGMLMEHSQVDADRAFDRLRRLSQESNISRRLVEVDRG